MPTILRSFELVNFSVLFWGHPVTTEFPTDPGISTSMSLRYVHGVLGFFQNARCTTAGRSSPASARVSAPPDLKEGMVNAVRSPGVTRVHV